MYLLCGFYIFGRKGGLLAMPRMSKKRKQEWALFLNERNRITYNGLCRKCSSECKQSFRCVVVHCPKYLSKRRTKNYENEMNVTVPLEVIKASEIEPKEVKWLWYPYLPFGKVTLLQGDPGDGKSKLMLSIAALLSNGELLSTDCEEKLEAAGFKKSTVKKARKKAGVISQKKGFQWYWSLPAGGIPKE